MSALPWPGWPGKQKVSVAEVDPDLHDNELAVLIEAAAAEVRAEGRRVAATGGPDHTLRAVVVHCIGRECKQAGLAYVWRTSHGLLFWASLVYAHDHNPVPPGMLATHPNLPGQVIEVTAAALAQHHQARGWVPRNHRQHHPKRRTADNRPRAPLRRASRLRGRACYHAGGNRPGD